MNTDYLIIDLEATCDNGGLVPRDEMEIIEIGGVLVDHETLEPIDEFASVVRPVRRRTLTPFCVELTSITQAQVDAAPRFPAVMHELADFVARHIAEGTSVDDFREAVLEELVRREEEAPTFPVAPMREDHARADFTGAMAEALAARVDPSIEPSHSARQFVGLSIPEMARRCLDRRGETTIGTSPLIRM